MSRLVEIINGRKIQGFLKVLDRVDLSVGYHPGGFPDTNPINLRQIIERIRKDTSLIKVRSQLLLPRGWKPEQGMTLVTDTPGLFDFYWTTDGCELNVERLNPGNLLTVYRREGDRSEPKITDFVISRK